jgi:hypothetical protein
MESIPGLTFLSLKLLIDLLYGAAVRVCGLRLKDLKNLGSIGKQQHKITVATSALLNELNSVRQIVCVESDDSDCGNSPPEAYLPH